MYCPNCGTKGDTNFCTDCGTQLKSSAETPNSRRGDDRSHPSVVDSGDWEHEIVYERLLEHPVVRDRIKQAGRRSRKHISGEDLMGVFDTVVATGVPLKKLTVALLPVYDRMGIRTAKKSELTITTPAGRALLATLCALASSGYELKKVDQSTDGCVLTAELPSTLWTNRGELVVALRRHADFVLIEAATKVPGQLYDWGKSKRILRDLFAEIQSELSSQRDSTLPPSRHVA